MKKKDLNAAAGVAVRMQRLALGNPGDVKPVGDGVSELRIPYGPGYRVYFTAEGDLLILLLTGGAKPTRQADINQAKRLARAWREERA
ncbi:MAG: type II toxin-antitoxin system RelE/ParE family toxin [Actinobacteria bacterium]|nr:type II toxin-antitoxin system RelE/ParE family toxin [Actinomycetota bacterium]